MSKEELEAELQAYKYAHPDWSSLEFKTNYVTSLNNRLAALDRVLPGKLHSTAFYPLILF